MYRFLFLALIVLTLSSCDWLKPSIMLKTPKGYKYTPPPSNPILEYKIAPNDILEFRIYTNDGFRLIDMTAFNTENSLRVNQSFNYIVEFDGNTKLPLLGMVNLKGMTVREAEVFLEEKYGTFYNKPFVLLRVTNRRVIVFPGGEGSAKVIPLSNERTTVIEALAQAGGLYQTGKAKKIKLIRGDFKNPEVYLIDLSTINGMQAGEMILQANDIIYVEPRLQIGKTFLSEITRYLTFITSAFLVYTIITR